MRTLLFVLLALLLAGCTMPAASPPLPTPAPDPVAEFRAAYAEFRAAYTAIAAKMERADMATAFDDPTFRADVLKLAQEWRAAANTVRYLEQPEGEKWAQAWPRIQDAMEEFASSASVIEQAAVDNNPFVLLGGGGRLGAAMALLNEAMVILEDEWQ